MYVYIHLHLKIVTYFNFKVWGYRSSSTSLIWTIAETQQVALDTNMALQGIAYPKAIIFTNVLLQQWKQQT